MKRAAAMALVAGLLGCAEPAPVSVAARADPLAVTAMPGPRALGATAQLSDGRVLVLGGEDTGGSLQSTAWYRPGLGNFTPGPALSQPRSRLAVAVLRTGEVLALGGTSDGGATATVDRLDPATSVFTAAAAMNAARVSPTANRLAGGQVLVTGGEDDAGNALASAELYDPANDTWTLTSPMATPRSRHTATRLRDGRVLVVGGPSAELFDPDAGAFTDAGFLADARFAHTATLLGDGTVLVVGGTSSTLQPLPGALRFDPASGQWLDAGMLSIARAEHSATLLPDGTVLVAGGTTGISTAACERYLPDSGTWTTPPTMLSRRRAHQTQLLTEGRVLLAGGFDTNPGAAAELFDPSTPSWVAAAPLPVQRLGRGLALLDDGTVLYVGGTIGATFYAEAYVYDPGSNTWATAGQLRTPKDLGEGPTRLPDGRMLVAGNHNQNPTLDADFFDPASRTWSPAPDMPGTRAHQRAGELPDRRILVIGGYNPTAPPFVFDPRTESWSLAPDAGYRENASVKRLTDGRMVVVGGYTLATELFNPANWTWAAGSAAPKARQFPTLVLLDDGRMLSVGGQQVGVAVPDFTAQVYDPVTDGWAFVASSSYSHNYYAAGGLQLRSGRVLMPSGEVFGTPIDNFEIYDPAGNVWVSAGAPNPAQTGPGVVRLRDGRVLVMGGGRGAVSDVALFDEGLASGPWKPTLSLPYGAVAGQTLDFTGTRLAGVSEGAGGNASGGATDVPAMFLRDPSNGQVFAVRVTQWTDSSAKAVFPAALRPAFYWARLVVNGVSSDEVPFNIGSPLDAGCGKSWECASGLCGGGVCTQPPDAGPSDGGPSDAGPADAGPTDGGPTDGGPGDAGPGDAGPADGGKRLDAGFFADDKLGPVYLTTCGCQGTGPELLFAALALSLGLVRRPRQRLRNRPM